MSVSVVLLATWMGYVDGGYFVSGWAPVTLVLAVLTMIYFLLAAKRSERSWWITTSTGLLGAYAVWSFASLLWSPNRGAAWIGADHTLLYLLVFSVIVALVGLGASRRWILIASCIGPGLVAAFTLPALAPHIQDLFRDDRLLGTIGYHNGEAAFLLVPFWTSVYLAGSRSVNPLIRALVLAGAVLNAEVAVLTQSRGAMVAMAISLPVFFLLSGKRLRGLLAFIPIAIALFVTFPGLNRVYLEFLNDGSPAAALDQVVPTVWLSAAGAGIYGLLWGLVDQWWRPRSGVVRIAEVIAIISVAVTLVFGGLSVYERVGNPLVWGEQKWEAFKTDDKTGEETSRYLSVSGSGRYTLWKVAWNDFVSHPILGIGTYNYEATYYQKRDQAVGFVRQPHMLPLEVLAEKGVVGGFLFFGFLAVCVVAGLWARFKRLDSEGKAQVGAITAALTYWFVHSSAEWFWQLPAITLPAMVYLAMLVAPWNRGEEEATPYRWPIRLAGAGFALVAIAAVAPLYAADRYLAESETITNPKTSLQAVENAQKFNPVDPQLRQREAELLMKMGDWSGAARAYEQEIRLNPEHYAPYALLATFHENRGELDKALPLYQKASDLNPLDPDLKRKAEEIRKDLD